ncbi:MAG: acyltransferase [Isosphaeraceae bacterium]|nr:acyltransferase [Isosphaeraceae bacterium]
MQRTIELDGVRAIAALAILVFHLDNRLLPQGWLAVDLFMLLSGFLITSIVLTNGRTDRFLRNFYLRRGLRTWPIYYLSLAVVFLVSALLRQPVLGSLPYYLTFTQNVPYYWSTSVPPFPWYFIHTWSLAVEEQYYLFWPALVLLAGRKWVIPLSCALAALCTAARAGGAHWTLLIARCDGFALGGVLAMLFDDTSLLVKYRRHYVGGFALVGAASIGIALGLWSDAVVPTAAPLVKSLWMLAVNCGFFGMLGLVIVHAGHPALGTLRNPSLGYLGRVSYGLYLYHPLVFMALDRGAAALKLPQTMALGFVKLGATVLLASISWRFVERPILALKSRFPYREEHVGVRRSVRHGGVFAFAAWSSRQTDPPLPSKTLGVPPGSTPAAHDEPSSPGVGPWATTPA